jgi:hypothetical protein
MAPATSAASQEVEPTAQPDVTVAGIVISGRGITTKNAAGETVASVNFLDGDAELAEFITSAVGEQPRVSVITEICEVPFTEYSWGVENGNGAVTLHVPEEFDPPFLSTFVMVGAADVNGIPVRSSTGFAVGDDVSSVPQTLPPAQIVDLHANVSVGGSPDPTSFVFDPAGEIEYQGEMRSYGGAVLAEAGIAQLIFAPRTTISTLC